MSRVFISYRREDSRWASSAIAINIERTLGEGSVFMDIQSLPIGLHWKDELDAALDTCEVALVIIGDKWLDCRDAMTGQRRLDSAGDIVRLEIERSLERGIPVVPVALDGTGFPSADELPDDIRELADRNGFSVEHRHHETQIRNLIVRLELKPGSQTASLDLDVSAREGVDLRQELTRFLKVHDRWSFSSLRIANWGARQKGFESLGAFTTDQIKSELEKMTTDDIVSTRLSKKGGTLYRLK